MINKLIGYDVTATNDFRFKDRDLRYISFKNSAWVNTRIKNIKDVLNLKRIVRLYRSHALIENEDTLKSAIMCNSRKYVFTNNTFTLNGTYLFNKYSYNKDN